MPQSSPATFALALVASAGAVSGRSCLTVALVALWGVRLAWHVGRRSHGRPEDPRYAAMRARRGPSFWWRSLYVVFWLQAALQWIIAWPILRVVTASGPPLGALDLIGVVIALAGFACEVISDTQL